MKVSVSSTLNCPTDKVWQLVTKSSTLLFVTKGFMGFRSLSGEFPSYWREGETERMRILLFGFIPAWKHEIHFKEVNTSKKQLLTNEVGGLISTWNHLMSVQPITSDTCQYDDIVEIQAGVFTVFVWLYANMFYRYRQYRWKKLVKTHTASI